VADIDTATSWDGGTGVFYNLDDALFDDTAAAGTIDIPDAIEPGTITVNNDTVAFSFDGTGSIDGPASLLKQGPGTLAINTSNGYTGGTLIEGGVVEISGGDALGTGTVTISQGTLRQPQPNANLVVNPLVLGDANSGSAETILEYSLKTGNVLNMPIVVSEDAPDSKAIIRVIGTAAASTGATYFAGAIQLENRDIYHDNAAERIGGLSGKISGTGNLHCTRQSGKTNRTRLINNNNDFVGDVYVDGNAYLQIGGGSPTGTVTSIPTGSDVIIGPEALVRATGANCYIGALRGGGNIAESVWGGGITTTRLHVGTGDKSGTYDGAMFNGNDRLALTKTGTGTQILNGECTFTGSTIVNGGTLEINSGTYASAVTVNADATLGGTGTLNDNLTATQTGATVAPGASTGTLAVDGDANLGGGTLAIEIHDAATPQNDRLDVGGTLTLDGATLDVTTTGSPGQSAYVIASYGTLVGTFAVENIPAGYEVDYNYLAGNQIAVKIAGGNDYESWTAGFGLAGADAAPSADPDSDTVPNADEYAFGLDPTSPASVTSVGIPLDKTAGTFTYTRRNPALTGLSYTVETSTTLATDSWTTDAGAVQNVVGTVGDVQTVEVTLSGAPLAAPALFARVSAQ